MAGQAQGDHVNPYRVVLVTSGSREEAERLASSLVEEKLAACVNLVPGLSSIYWWKGEVERAEEILLVIKTRQDLLGSLVERVKSLHSYTVPEVIALPILGGNEEYLRWMEEVLKAPAS
ncbi:MAG: divalent-cation tolerance protein CutA [Armatimonadota bacterium]|nr:divalent-cation tolerance protein CutA [Armatimonadota bacterium]MDR5703931.1 divalent-cation tolerance protein CutA [Armatimonadota bacterium]